jgi:hypothetical protein
MTTDTHTRTDGEFLDEILQLINGTHWKQGTLKDSCWVPLPEGMSLEEAKAAFGTTVETKLTRIVQRIMPVAPEKQEVEVYDEEEQPWMSQARGVERKQCYLKFQYCLVGMVLQVASLEMEENKIEEDSQELRVIRLLYAELPENLRERTEKHLQHEVEMVRTHFMVASPEDEVRRADRSYKIGAIESWNDELGRTKQDVIDLVTRARDKANQS